MPVYEFQARDGSLVERFYSMSEAPEIGQSIRIGAKLYKRIPSSQERIARPTIHFVDHTLPRFWPHAKRHSADGKPMFDSRAEVREAERRSKDSAHDAVTYDR